MKYRPCDSAASNSSTTRAGERYPCRILDFAAKSPALRELLDDPRFLAIGELLGVGHRPGDPFGELVDGCEMDVRGRKYVELADLVEYCRCVAGSIGRLSLGVFGPTLDTAARDEAE